MTGHFVFAWLLAKQSPEKCTLLVDIIGNAGGKDCRARCTPCSQVGTAVARDRYGEDDAVLPHDVLDNEEFELVWLI